MYNNTEIKSTVHIETHEASHEGSYALVGAVIDKLGTILHRCGIITEVEMHITWRHGGTHEVPFRIAEIEDVETIVNSFDKISSNQQRIIQLEQDLNIPFAQRGHEPGPIELNIGVLSQTNPNINEFKSWIQDMIEFPVGYEDETLHKAVVEIIRMYEFFHTEVQHNSDIAEHEEPAVKIDRFNRVLEDVKLPYKIENKFGYLSFIKLKEVNS